MRSFAKSAVLVLVTLAPAVHAQTTATSATSQPKRLYEDALARERMLRADIQLARTNEAQSSVLTRVRALVGAYDDMSRLFPSSGYGDNALWQGAVLAADAFWQFGDPIDRTSSLRLFSALTARYPGSALALLENIGGKGAAYLLLNQTDKLHKDNLVKAFRVQLRKYAKVMEPAKRLRVHVMPDPNAARIVCWYSPMNG